MPHFGGKNAKKKSSSSTTKRNFTVVIGSKEHGLYVSSSPSSAARKAVSKLCATDKKRKVSFHIREITQKSKKKTYGPYLGYIEKLAKPIELKGRVIRYKPVAKLSGKSIKKSVVKKGGMRGGRWEATDVNPSFFEAFSTTANETIKIQGVKETQKFDCVPTLIDKFREIQKSINPLINQGGKMMCFGKPISGQIKNLENSNSNISSIISRIRGNIKFYFSYLIISSEEDGNNIIQIFELSLKSGYSDDYNIFEITKGEKTNETFSDDFKEALKKLKEFIEIKRESNRSFGEEIYNYISSIFDVD